MAFGDPNDPATQAFAKALGIPADQVGQIASGLGGGNASSADDPPIYYGSTSKPAGFDTELKSRNRPTETVKPYSQYLNDFYALNKQALMQFQQRAYQAGLYGNAKPRFGDPNDDVAFGIWQDIGKRAAGFKAAGQNFTPGDVLDMAVQSAPADQRQARAYQTRTDIIQTQDPDTIRQAAHDAFKAATGRGRRTGDPVIEKFVAEFTGRQVSTQRKVNRAQDTAEIAGRQRQEIADQGGDPGGSPVSQEVTVAAPDLGSGAAAFAQRTAPAEVGAHNITKQFDGFLKLLGGIV